MPIIWIIILALAHTIAGGVFSAKVARAKGYDPFAWFFAGFFFSILALITLAALPANPEAEQ